MNQSHTKCLETAKVPEQNQPQPVEGNEPPENILGCVHTSTGALDAFFFIGGEVKAF